MKDQVKIGDGLVQYFPWIVVGVAGLLMIWFMIPSSASKKYADFASLPVVDRGRMKPFDTFARTSLMIISGKQTYKDEKKPPETHSAVEWLLEVMSGGPRLQNPVANDSKVFRIENLQVLAFLGLQPRPGSYRYSIAEIGSKIDDIILERKRITETLDPKKLTLYDHKIVELGDHLKIYLDIAHWKTPYCVPPLAGGHPDDWKPLLYGIQDRDTFAMYLGRMLMAYGDGDLEQFNSIVERLQKDLNKEMPQTMEASRFEVSFNYFAPFYKCIELYVFVFVFACLSWLLSGGEGAHILAKMIYGVVCFATLLSFTGTVLGGIWADQSWGRFWGWDPKENGALMIVIWNALILHARWAGMIKQRGLALLAIGGNIVTAWSWFGVNMLGVGLHSYGFMSGAVYWLVAFVVSQLILIGVGAFLPVQSNPFKLRPGWAQALNRAAFWLMVFTLVIHTIALLGRMYLQGRPPVTNLYSSAVFIGWGGVILGLILEAVFKNGIGNVVGSVLGGLTLIIAHYLATSGDTLEMMQAVLDTNFWLATHVTCVTLGYTATFVAGFIGILFVVFNILIPRLGQLLNGKAA
jgi:ABC-type transport system involved in cytochrome c biogenesis permease subunit